MERNQTNTGKNKQEKAGSDPTIQYIIIKLLTKYYYSSLHGFTGIFDEKFHYSKYGKEENWTNTGKNKHQKASSQSNNTIHHYQSAYQI